MFVNAEIGENYGQNIHIEEDGNEDISQHLLIAFKDESY